MGTYRVTRSAIVHRDELAYIAHPSIVILKTGEWLMAFEHTRRRNSIHHSVDEPLMRHIMARSSDEGATWSEPYFVPDFDWYGVSPPGIEQLQDGTVVLHQSRWAWYPLAAARKRKAAGEDIYLRLGGSRGWTNDYSESDWGRSERPWARGYRGCYVHLSHDDGWTFDDTVKIDTAPYPGGTSRVGVTQLADGRVAFAMEERPVYKHVYVVLSDDNCRTWSKPITIGETIGFQYPEPDLMEVAPGELFCIIRDSGLTEHLHSSRSFDRGETWTPIERTPMYGHPGQLVSVADGRLLCTYGRRKFPFGIRACLSEDRGRTWLMDQEIIIRDDLPNKDLGYPATVEYRPGKLFCCYYGQDTDGVTCVQGTYFEID